MIIDIELNKIYDTSDITINGMTCASCSSSVENHIKSLDGIKEVNVNLITGKGHIEYNVTKINIRYILEEINNMGFDAFITKENNEGKVVDKLLKEKLEMLKKVIILSILGMLGIIGMILMIIEASFYMREVYPGIRIDTIYMFLLSTPVQFGIALGFYKKVWKQITNNSNYNMETLIILSTTLAYILSIWIVILNVINQRVIQNTFFETSVFIFMFVYIGKYLELIGKIWAAKEMTKVILNTKDKVLIMKENSEVMEVEEDLICIGDVIQVKPNQRIPCDGKIILNSTQVDESMITGEFIPVNKDINECVYAGSINISNTVHIKALQTGNNTLVNRMISLVENAQSNKTSFQSTTDLVCKWFVKIVLIIASIDFIVWCIIGYLSVVDIPDGFNYITFALYSSISVIVVACPCALGLATPMVIMVGSGMAMKRGILIKDGADSLEKMSKMKAIVFDKTGTLTEGKMYVVDKLIEDENILEYLSKLASISNHPISKCLKEMTSNIDVNIKVVNEKIYNGKGVECEINGVINKLGSVNWLNKELYSDDMKSKLETWYNNGYSIVVQSIDDKIVGMYALTDKVRKDAKEVVNKFQDMSIDVWMVSGDNKYNAMKVSKDVGINEEQVMSNILPESKSEIVEAIQLSGCSRVGWNGYKKMENKIVAMVGDGGNDSIALAQSDIGISMRHGSDLALSSASVVLMKSDINDVYYFKKLSDKIMKKIYMNLIWAMGYNIIGIPLAAGLFHPWHISPMCAGLAMSFSSIFVVINSLLLKRSKIE
jgi:Cu+-exporting ATPase